jgi:hypothetical protein
VSSVTRARQLRRHLSECHRPSCVSLSRHDRWMFYLLIDQVQSLLFASVVRSRCSSDTRPCSRHVSSFSNCDGQLTRHGQRNDQAVVAHLHSSNYAHASVRRQFIGHEIRGSRQAGRRFVRHRLSGEEQRHGRVLRDENNCQESTNEHRVCCCSSDARRLPFVAGKQVESIESRQ